MDSYSIINQIDISCVFEKLKIWYSKIGNSLFVNDDTGITSWRKVKISENFINDFSWKWRPSWPPFAFVKKYLKLSDKETFEWFEENFGIWWEMTNKTKKIYKKREIVRLPAYSMDR